MLSFMLFTFLGFLCVIALLLYFLYMQEKLFRTLRDEHAEMRLLLRAMEAKLRSPEGAQGAGRPEGADADTIAHDAEALLHLDFSTPLEAKKGADPGLDLHLETPSEPKR